MPRPKTKAELLTLSQENYDKLIDYIDSLTEKERGSVFSPGTMNRNIRDVLAHLHHWHLMMMEWHAVGMKNEKPDIPAKGYTWKTTPALNKWIWEKYRKSDLRDIRKLLHKTHSEIVVLIKKYSNEQLFEKKRYKWTGTTSLGAYLISATSSHYDWALKLIKKGLK